MAGTKMILNLTARKKTFNVQVLYDTLELYGKVSASRPVTVYRD